ncbi:MAG: M23 family metallopeptidase [Alphaproteobacteria bacterium]
MQYKDVFVTLKNYVNVWFHKRNVIIVSEHKVKHLHVSGRMQFAALMLAVGCIFWASYSTGRYMAARHTLKEQAIAMRAMTPIRLSEPLIAEEKNIPEVEIAAADTSSLSQPELLARVAMLEKQVDDLKTSKEDIIERVKLKTSGQIDELEAIIEQTGLSPKDLKRNFVQKKALPKPQASTKTDKGMGGPFIPDTSYIATPEENELFTRLDELAALKQIIGLLPLASPMKNGEEQSHFGRRIDPFSGRLAFHSGLDISGPNGSQIYATGDGKVKKAEWSSTYGNYVDIDHGYNISTRYAHLSRINVSAGQKIKKGDVLGIQGSTGRSTGNHLHYEVRYREQTLNPKKFLNAGQYVLEN